MQQATGHTGIRQLREHRLGMAPHERGQHNGQWHRVRVRNCWTAFYPPREEGSRRAWHDLIVEYPAIRSWPFDHFRCVDPLSFKGAFPADKPNSRYSARIERDSVISQDDHFICSAQEAAPFWHLFSASMIVVSVLFFVLFFLFFFFLFALSMAQIHPWAVQCVGWENKKVKEEEKKENKSTGRAQMW